MFPNHLRFSGVPARNSVHFRGLAHLDQNINTGLQNILKDFDQRVLERGQFPDFVVDVQATPNKVVFKLGSFEGGFEAEPVPEYQGRRYFEVLVFTPSGKSSSKSWVFTGSKQELLGKLQSLDTPQKIKNAIKNLQQSLQQNDYR